MANKPYKNYKGELITNCPKPEGTCLEPNHLTKKQLTEMRKTGFSIPIFAGDTVPRDTVATSKQLKNQKVGKTTVAGNPALVVELPELVSRRMFLVKDPGDDYTQANVVILFSDAEFDGDEAYNDQINEYAKYGQSEIPYTVVKTPKGDLFFADSNVGGMLAFKDLEKAEPLRETFDEYLTDTEKIMFDENGKIISDTILPNLPAKAKEWLVDNASYIRGMEPDEDKAYWDYLTSGDIVGKVEEL